MHCPVEGVHVLGEKGTADRGNQLTKLSATEYIAQTVFACLVSSGCLAASMEDRGSLLDVCFANGLRDSGRR